MKRAQPQRAGPARRAREWRGAVIALAIVLTYANSLSGPFVLDDQASVVQNRSIRDLSRMSSVLAPDSDSPVAGRPLVNLSFAINYSLGGLDVRGYHLWNIGAHLVCALLAFALIRLTLELPRVRPRIPGEPADLAFAAALLWAVHPLNTEVLNYLSQRTESMMGGFYLLTMYASARGALSRRPAAWQTMAVTACTLGMLCKESMATAPFLVVLYDGVFLFDSWRGALRSRWKLYLGLTASWVVLAAVVASNPRSSVAGASSGVPVWTYLLNQAGMIVEYLRLTLWPRSLVAFYGWPAPLTLGDVLPQAMLVVALLLATAIALARAPLVGFLGAWFFVTLAPASSIVPISTEVGAERRMYLPLLALAVLIVVGARAIWVRVRSVDAGSRLEARVVAAVLIAITGALSAASILRNREYSSLLTLTETIVDRRPSGVAHHMFGEQLEQAGRTDEAVTHLREAVARGNSRAGFLLGVTLLNQGHTAESIERLEAFIRTEGVRQTPRWLEPSVADIVGARLAMGLAFARQRDWARASEQATLILAAAPRHPDGRGLLAQSLFGQERWTDAVREYREYLNARPRDMAAILNLGVALVATGNLDAAIAVFGRAVEIDPTNSNAKRLLAMAQRDRAGLADGP